MKIYECLFEQTGENVGTPKSLRGLLAEFPSVDLQAQIRCCRSFDDNGLVETERYAVLPIALPNWLTFAEYNTEQVKWEFLFYFLRGEGLADIDSLNPEIAYLLLQLSDARHDFYKLMTAKLRSGFKLSLRQQVEAWLSTPASERKYSFPLSTKQLHALAYRVERYGSDHYAYEHFQSYSMTGWIVK